MPNNQENNFYQTNSQSSTSNNTQPITIINTLRSDNNSSSELENYNDYGEQEYNNWYNWQEYNNWYNWQEYNNYEHLSKLNEENENNFYQTNSQSSTSNNKLNSPQQTIVQNTEQVEQKVDGKDIAWLLRCKECSKTLKIRDVKETIKGDFKMGDKHLEMNWKKV